MLVVQVGHSQEIEVVRQAPVEALLRELEHALVNEAHGDVVIILQSYWRLPCVSLTGDFSPEKQFVEIFLICMQSVQRHLQLHPGNC